MALRSEAVDMWWWRRMNGTDEQYASKCEQTTEKKSACVAHVSEKNSVGSCVNFPTRDDKTKECAGIIFGRQSASTS